MCESNIFEHFFIAEYWMYRTVATYQTLNNEERLQKFDPRTLKAIVVDEAHHSAAPSFVQVGIFLGFYLTPG